MKVVYGVVLAVLLASCSPFGLNPMGYEVLHEDLDVAWKKVSSMEYQSDPLGYWKSPVEFFRDGGGDCEDFATALIYLLGPDAEMVVAGTNFFHCHSIVSYKDKYIEPQIYEKYYERPTNVLKTLSYNDVMWYTTWLGCKNIQH